MKKLSNTQTILATAIVLALATSPVMAKDLDLELSAEQLHQQKVDNENIGFGTGAVIGALVAGPLGAIVAGVGGIFIAKHMNVTDDVELLTADLAQAKDHLRDQKTELAVYQSKLVDAEHRYDNDIAQIKLNNDNIANKVAAENLLMSLQFSTGSSEISAHYQEQIASVAQALNDQPLLNIDLSGYTDLAGDEKINQALSIARVQSVKALLVAQGVDEGQINTYAYGETAPIAANSEQEINFYDRRVVLKLHSPVNQMAKR